jgi:gliding motility-associated-like protein
MKINMKYYLFVISLVISLKSISQINMGNLGTVTNGCGQNFYDSGGPGGNYGSSQNYTTSFCAPAGQYITFTFSQFAFGTGDHLFIYNGPSTASALIGDFATSPGQVSSTLGGCLTFVFTSNAPTLGFITTNGAGWTAAISCAATIPPPPPPPPGTCAAAQPFCTSTGATYPAAVGTTSEAGPSYGCLSTQPSPGWFYLNIATNGNIMINLSNSAAHDIDFAIWGPFATQAAMCAGTTNAPLDCSYDPAATEQVDIPNAVAGQWYMMLITNYANTPTNISAIAGNATGTDGTTNCNILCNMTALTATPGACVPATGLYDVTGQITLNYPPTSGTLTISSSCGPSTTVGLPWTSPISYTLPGLTANGAACNITATFSADPTCTLTTPITAPASCTSTCAATASNTGPYCVGSTIQLNSTGGGTYSWAGPGGFTSTAQNPTLATSTTAMSGNYTVTVTSGTATCTATTSVTVNALPVVAVNSPTICAGQTATLTASGATTYSWNTGSTANPLSVSPASTTNYTVTGTIGTCTNTAVAIVTVNPLPVVTVNSPSICPGGTASLTASGATTYSWNTGSTSNPLSVTPGSTTSYTVTGTALTCTATAVATVTVGGAITPTVNSPTICVGQTATLTAAGGTTYTWSTGSTANPLSVSPTSTTSYTVTAVTGACTGTVVAVVTVNPLPTITVNSETICPGGTATLTAAGATTYSWNTGSTANPLSVTPGSTTSYTVTGDLLGCTSTTVATVTIGAGIVATVNSPTICVGQTATLTATGGTTYSWDTGATTNPLSVSPTTTTSYTVTANSGGCTGTAVAVVTVNPLPVPTVNSPTICFGQTATLTATGGTTYLWDTGSTSNPLSVNPATTTSYTVTATTLGCSATAVGIVTVNPIPITTVSSVTICPGAPVNLTASGADTYLWSNGSTANPLSVSPLATTSYTVTGTSLGCISTDIATVTVVNNLVVSAGVNDSICVGGNTNLNATPNGAGYSYLWATNPSLTGNTVFNPTVNPTTTTTYSVTITDAGGCTGTSTVTVLVDPLIDLSNISSVPVTCNGLCDGQTLVTPSGGSGVFTGFGTTPAYVWTNGSNTANSTTCAGTYTVVVTDSWGCSASNSVTVTEPTLLTASITNTPATCNSFCDGTATLTATGGTTSYTYSWNSSPIQTTATANNLCAGTFSVVVTDANGCTANATTIISEPTPVVIAPILPVSICTGSASITASASGGNVGGFTYAWTPTGTGTSATVTVSPTISSTYTVVATDIANGCVSAPVVATVNVSAPLSVSATGTDSICSGSTANLIASASGGNGNPYLYSWAPAISSTSATVTAMPTTNTTYTVTLSDGCSVPVTATVAVNVIALPQVNFTSNRNSGCATLCVDFVDNSSASIGSISSWNWNFGDGSFASSQQANHCFSSPGSYNISVTVVSTIGACTNTLTKNNFITVFANPTADFISNPEEPTVLDATIDFVDLSSSDVVSWNWSFGDGEALSGANSNPSHFYASEEAGTYEVQLIVKNIYNCVDSISKVLTINDVFTFYVPKAFSPNGDDANETFYGVGVGIDKYKMEIFDRWGNLIFKTVDLKNTWDGRANNGNDIALEDVYVWKVDLTDIYGMKHNFNGIVSLIR